MGLTSLFSISHEQAKTTGVLACLFFLIIGTFWLLGSLQEPIFYHLVGSQYHPQVNVISFICIIPLMFAYLALLDRFSARKLFMVMMGCYALFFTFSALLLAHPTIGLPNTVPHANRLLGWMVFAVIKTYGSFLVTLFWSLAVSVTTVEVAKKIFPFIVVCGQIGSLCATTLVRSASAWGIPLLMLIAVGGMLVTLYVLSSMRTALPLLRSNKPVSKSGIFEGFWLLYRRPYLRSVFVISTANLIVMAFMDYQMHYLAHLQYPTIEQFAQFKGMFGQLVNLCTLLLALGGAQWLLRVFGVPLCLLIYPAATAVCVVGVYMWPALWPLFIAMVAMRVLAFGLNNPTKEIVYIPENQDVKFKVKSSIDMVGYRASFALGSQLTSFFKDSFELLVPAGAIISAGIVAVWLYSAVLVGRQFSRRDN